MTNDNETKEVLNKKLNQFKEKYISLDDIIKLPDDRVRELNQFLLTVEVTPDTLRLAKLLVEHYESEAESVPLFGDGVGVPYPKFTEAAGNRSKANRLKEKYKIKSSCEQKTEVLKS